MMLSLQQLRLMMMMMTLKVMTVMMMVISSRCDDAADVDGNEDDCHDDDIDDDDIDDDDDDDDGDGIHDACLAQVIVFGRDNPGIRRPAVDSVVQRQQGSVKVSDHARGERLGSPNQAVLLESSTRRYHDSSYCNNIVCRNLYHGTSSYYSLHKISTSS